MESSSTSAFRILVLLALSAAVGAFASNKSPTEIAASLDGAWTLVRDRAGYLPPTGDGSTSDSAPPPAPPGFYPPDIELPDPDVLYPGAFGMDPPRNPPEAMADPTASRLPDVRFERVSHAPSGDGGEFEPRFGEEGHAAVNTGRDIAGNLSQNRQPPRTSPVDGQSLEALLDRLDQMGATIIRLHRTPTNSGRYFCRCEIPIPGNAKYRRFFQASTADPAEAVRRVVSQVEVWLQSKP